MGSTEVGEGSGITTTFSTCFGAPFFPRPAQVYADLLRKRLNRSHAKVYLINTGWTGGGYGQGGERFSIPTTRSVVSAILDGKLETTTFELFPHFNFEIPQQVTGIETKLLNPRNAWQDESAYKKNLTTLINKFNENFKRFRVDTTIASAGPTINS